jgi:Leucine-rich repeat (LRR) protein
VEFPDGTTLGFVNLSDEGEKALRTSISSVRDRVGIVKFSRCDSSLVNRMMLNVMMVHGMQFLNLHRCGVREIGFVSQLKHLRVLKMEGNTITHLVGLENLQQLEELYMGDNSIAELSSLNGLGGLNIIDFHRNQIPTLQ